LLLTYEAPNARDPTSRPVSVGFLWPIKWIKEQFVGLSCFHAASRNLHFHHSVAINNVRRVKDKYVSAKNLILSLFVEKQHSRRTENNRMQQNGL
jgi:hypothetical protein